MKPSNIYKGQWWLPDSPDNKVHGTLNAKTGKAITLALGRHLLAF